jgi:hypothetical protein
MKLTDEHGNQYEATSVRNDRYILTPVEKPWWEQLLETVVDYNENRGIIREFLYKQEATDV